MMNLLTTVLVLLVVGICATALAPVVAAGVGLLLAFGCLFIWLLPILIIVASDKTTGGEKLAWILAIIFLSWFAWVFYFLLAPIKKKPSYREYREYHSY